MASQSALADMTQVTTRILALLAESARDGWRGRHVAGEMFRREIARQYRQSILGVLLAFLPALVIAAWATMIQHTRIITLPPDMDLPYAPFVLISLMLWWTFVESIYAPIVGLKQELGTMARSTMPGEAIIMAKAAEVAFNFAVKLILIVAGMVWYQIPVTSWAFAAPAALALLILFGLGIGLFLAPLNIFYQDILASLGAITTFWLFLTPVIIPVPREGWASVIVKINPVTPLLATTRELATTGVVSQPVAFLFMAVMSVAVFLGGCLFYRVTLPVVIDRANF